jgi:hypothetical protein
MSPEMTAPEQGGTLLAYWGGREETVATCAQRLTHCLARLAQCEARLSRVFEPQRSLRDAFKREVSVDPVALGHLFGRVMPIPWGPAATSPTGFTVSLRLAPQPGAACAELRIHCGAYVAPYNPHPLNLCILALPTGGPDHARLHHIDQLASMLDALATSWAPDYASVDPFDYTNRTRRDRGQPLAGWLTYLPYAPSALPPDLGITQIRALGGHGSLLVMFGDSYPPYTPTGVAALDHLSETLERHGFLSPYGRVEDQRS